MHGTAGTIGIHRAALWYLQVRFTAALKLEVVNCSLLFDGVHLEVTLGNCQAGVAELPSAKASDDHSAVKCAAPRLLTG
jgi:hypothetical protein